MKQQINILSGRNGGYLAFALCHDCNGNRYDEHGSTCRTCDGHAYIHPNVTHLTAEEYAEFRAKCRAEAQKSYAIEDALREQIRVLEERIEEQHKVTIAMWDADGTHTNYQHNPINGIDYPGHWEQVADNPKWQAIIDALPAEHPYARTTA